MSDPIVLTDVLAANGYTRCLCCAVFAQRKAPWSCGRPRCILEPAAAPPDKERPAARRAPSKPSGSEAEEVLYAMLAGGGFHDYGEIRQYPGAGPTYIEFLDGPPGSFCSRADKGLPPLTHLFIRQYPWGAYLKPRRKYQSDAAFPVSRLLVEIEGGAHAVKRQRRHDVLRRQLAEGAGYRVLSVLPEQVRDGSALELVRAALVPPSSSRARGGVA